MSISEQEHQRRESLKDIIQLGLNPYPSEIFVINSSSDEIKNNFDEKKSNFNEVKIAGRLMSRRIMGSASFAEIQDSKGRIQIYVRRDDICPSEDKTLYNTLFKKFKVLVPSHISGLCRGRGYSVPILFQCRALPIPCQFCQPLSSVFCHK